MPPKRKSSNTCVEENSSTKRARRSQATIAEKGEAEPQENETKPELTRNTRKGKGKLSGNHASTSLQRSDTFKVAVDGSEGTCSCEENAEPEPKRKRTKGVDVSNPLPRDSTSLWKVGAHVSSAGGVENAILNAHAIGATSFALFLKSQRKWESPPLSKESITQFKANMSTYGYSSAHILPHGSYLINLANPDRAKRQKSYDCFLDDLKRCELLGLQLYNFHPGSTLGEPLEDALGRIASCINDAHAATNSVTIVLENMAGAGNVIGSDFSHLASIIALVDNKDRVGVCIDTCHAFAAGYDIRTQEGWDATIQKFDEVVGLKYLRGMHINDSKTELNSKRDRHESIGLGHLGLQAFKHIVNDPRTQNIPLVLETPSFEQPREVWGKEIEVLQRISGSSQRGAVPEARGDDDVATVPARADDAPTLEAYVEEIRHAVKTAEKNEKKPSSAKTKKAVGKKKAEQTDEDEDEEAEGDLQPKKLVKKANVRATTNTRKGRGKRKEIEEGDGDD
ncbi:hypothetical protein CVT24_005044 [Panaeolus cyanescens]|uniref:Apurinic-apyrimidinic endonuclease 1 n=1 Tax=Panaeolus cyanescens TaxID=181874 RepID=A0A409VPW2_9AGAR|nr:hypothetical protein CVT24_005044 [Panaeolus cyanescens]